MWVMVLFLPQLWKLQHFYQYGNWKLWVLPHGEPWHSHVRSFSPTPQLQSRYASARELTLLFSAHHPENCLPWGPFRWPHKYLVVVWSPANVQGRELVVLKASFLPSPSPPIIQNLSSSSPSTQVTPASIPTLKPGSSHHHLPVLSPILLRTWVLKTDSYYYTNLSLRPRRKWYLKVVLVRQSLNPVALELSFMDS